MKWTSLIDDIYPPEGKENAVLIFLRYGDGYCNVFTAHHKNKKWYTYDMFAKKFRVVRGQKYISHWATLSIP